MAACDAMLLFLHEAFMGFSEVLASESSNREACKVKLQGLQDQWHQRGLSGVNALNMITQYQAQIKWQDMPPDQFNKFYRFVFSICRDPGKRNIQMELAVAAWRLILPGRFRLLERWCAFAAASSSRVVTQDLWRQVLDFSRTVHEDLSNFDPAGSWAVLLDEFVEEMRVPRRRPYTSAPDGGSSADRLAHQPSSGPDMAVLFASATAAAGRTGFGAAGDGDADGALGCASLMSSISPRCGSKRRGPDVDVVAEQLSAMPLGAGHHHHAGAGGQGHGPTGLPPVRPGGPASPAYGYSVGALPYGTGGGGGGGAGFHRGNSPDALAKRPCLDRHPHLQHQHQPFSEPAGMAVQEQQLCQPQHCQQRRAIKARRSGLSDIVKSAVTDALGF